MRKLAATALAVSGLALGGAQAASITDFDASTFSFELDANTSGTTTSPTTITGTSNGIDFTYVGGNFTPFASTANLTSYTGLPGSYDDVHTAGGTFTFDTPIEALVIATRNNSSELVTIEMNGTAVDVQGSLGIVSGGVRYIHPRVGGIGLVVFDQAVTDFTLLVTNPADGIDFSVFAIEDIGDPVPVPGALLLMGSALSLYAGRRRLNR